MKPALRRHLTQIGGKFVHKTYPEIDGKLGVNFVQSYSTIAHIKRIKKLNFQTVEIFTVKHAMTELRVSRCIYSAVSYYFYSIRGPGGGGKVRRKFYQMRLFQWVPLSNTGNRIHWHSVIATQTQTKTIHI